MNELQVFTNDTFGEVRTIMQDNEPWFVAADVCRALEIGNPSQAISRLDDDEKFTTLISNESAATGKSSLSFVNEPGLYALVLGSRKPEAKAFKRWITHEVVPTIRKNGLYAADELLDNPDLLIKAAMRIKEQNEQIAQLETDRSKMSVALEIARPKAEYFDELVNRNTLTNFRDTAKLLGIPEKRFVKFLLDHDYIYRDKAGGLRAYSKKNDGLFEVKEYFSERSDWHGTQTLITPKGRETFRLLCQGV